MSSNNPANYAKYIKCRSRQQSDRVSNPSNSQNSTINSLKWDYNSVCFVLYRLRMNWRVSSFHLFVSTQELTLNVCFRLPAVAMATKRKRLHLSGVRTPEMDRQQYRRQWRIFSVIANALSWPPHKQNPVSHCINIYAPSKSRLRRPTLFVLHCVIKTCF